MNFEVLKKNYLKRNILIGVGLIAIVSACILTFSLAKYRDIQSIQIAKGTINYATYDFKVLAMYQESDSGYTEINEMPSSGYAINESMSYCTIDNVNKDTSVRLYTLSTGEHVIQGLKKNSKCYLYFDKLTTREVDTVLGTIKVNLDAPDFSNTSCSVGTNNGRDCDEVTVGIYAAKDNDGTSYYYRGDVNNNWVQFAGFYWRIIRINGNGSIRMIYAGTNSNVTTGSGTQISLDGSTTTYRFNKSQDASYYVGLKYSTSQHGTATDSSIMETLNTWYSSNLASYASYIDQNAGFCSDREMASGYTWSATPSGAIHYAAYERLITNKMPTLSCGNEDLFTATGANKGNASLSNPIGLITADEVAMAGGVTNFRANSGYYLYTNQDYWTMSPYNFSSFAFVFYVGASGDLTSSNVYYGALGIRPVINLRADVTLSGTGTSSDPYRVV